MGGPVPIGQRQPPQAQQQVLAPRAMQTQVQQQQQKHTGHIRVCSSVTHSSRWPRWTSIRTNILHYRRLRCPQDFWAAWE
eukprot:5263907-Pyramimonas_sp.AAC.1